jgi:hypothetical protein
VDRFKKYLKEYYETHKREIVYYTVGAVAGIFATTIVYKQTHISVAKANGRLMQKFDEVNGCFVEEDGHWRYLLLSKNGVAPTPFGNMPTRSDW